MTIGDILTLNQAFAALNEQSKHLTAKAKWNLAMNLKRCQEVAKSFEEQRIELFNKLVTTGAQKITPADAAWPAYKSEVEALMNVETDTKVLHFEFSDIVRDDLEISSDLIAQLEQVIDNKPE